jgi:hypothetical protein
MIPIIENQRKTIFSLLPEAVKSSSKQRKILVSNITKDNSRTSLNDLSFTEANSIIVKYGGKAFTYDNWAFFDVKNPQHRKVLSVCLNIGWSKYNTDKKRHFADIYKLSEWLKSKRSPVQKPLKKQSTTELTKVINALESIFLKDF